MTVKKNLSEEKDVKNPAAVKGKNPNPAVPPAKKKAIKENEETMKTKTEEVVEKTEDTTEVTEDTTEIKEETAASETLKTYHNTSKAKMMADIMDKVSSMAIEDMSHLLTDTLAQVGRAVTEIPDGTAEKNKASTDAKGTPTGVSASSIVKTVKEDVVALFGSEELTEEFKEKASVIFESALSAKIITEVARLEEEFQTKLDEEVAKIAEAHDVKIDQFLSYTAKNWLSENEVAIDTSLRAEITEDFINGLKDLFSQHYAQIPEEKVDAVTALVDKVESLETKLNEQIKANMIMNEALVKHEKEKLFTTVSEGLASTQVEKFKTLVEGVDYENDASYTKKLEIIKEHHFGTKTDSKAKDLLNEEVETSETVKSKPNGFTTPEIRRYAEMFNKAQ